VIGFLIRTEPFSTLHILLQEGRYDHPARLFFSIPNAWQSVTGTSIDFRELIPEFFFNPHFLTNENGFDLGTRDSASLSEVVLPAWAHSPHDFISVHRRALEGAVASAHLHAWIDLIFGVSQRSEEHNTLYHCFSYADAAQLDGELLLMARDHCANFGVCPQRLFAGAHPRRDCAVRPPLELQPVQVDGRVLALSGEFALLAGGAIAHLPSRTVGHGVPLRAASYALYAVSATQVLAATGDETCVHVFDRRAGVEAGILPHRTSIVKCFALLADELLLTGGSDCSLYVWNPRTLAAVAKIASHSVPILGIAGSAVLDAGVSIDEEGNVCILDIGGRRVAHMFAVAEAGHVPHSVKLGNGGTIAVAFCTPGNVQTHSVIAFYDLCGGFRGKIGLNGGVEEVITVDTDDFCEYIAVTTSKKTVYVLDCARFAVVKKSNEPISPRFVSYYGGKAVMLVRERAGIETIVAFEFGTT
jgi:hypothetical protein